MRRLLLFLLLFILGASSGWPAIAKATRKTQSITVTAEVLESFTYICKENECTIMTNSNYTAIIQQDFETRIITSSF